MNYKTVLNETSAEFVEKRSRFIGYIKPVQTEKDALEFISKIKSLNHEAKHNVYAYVLRENNIMRYSDAGEPQGTAGMPTLDVLQKSGITDVAIVTARYFGGILLGGGGLVRAYSKAASEAVMAAGIVTMELCKVMVVDVPYTLHSTVLKVLETIGATIINTDFTDIVHIEFALQSEFVEQLNDRLTQATCGSITATEIGEKYSPIGG